MFTFNEKSDELERQVEKIDLCQEVDSHQACYENLLEKQSLTEEARQLRQTSRNIRKNFIIIIEKDFYQGQL